MTIHAVPKPKKSVRVRKRLQAHPGAKAFPHRRVPEYEKWIRQHACVAWLQVPQVGYGPQHDGRIECAHVKSRGAGGDDVGNCWPACHHHHLEQHALGIQSFQKKYGLDLYAIAKDLGVQYRARVQATEDT